MASVSRNAGGLYESVRRLHQSLASLPDVNVTVLGLEDEHTAADLPAWAPVSAHCYRVIGPRAFGCAPSLRRALLETDIEILHVHGIWQYPSVAALSWHRKYRRPYTISPHGMLDPWAVRNSAWKKSIAKIFYESQHLKSAACIRGLCRSEADSIRQFGLKNPICIIPNGIDLPDLDHGQWTIDNGPEKRNRGPLSGLKKEGRKVLLYLGRIHPKKGLVNLLKAWAAVQRSEARGQRSDWVLAVAGWDQGGHEAELKQLATELGIAWKDVREPGESKNWKAQSSGAPISDFSFQDSAFSVLFLGPQFNEDKAACYRNCDAFVLPSLSEGLPMVILEAWAHARPVLMTPECNLPEGFAAGAAIRIEPNLAGIRAGLGSLFRASRSELQAMGSAGRTLVADRFAWRRIAGQMREVYDWLLGGGAKPGFVQGGEC